MSMEVDCIFFFFSSCCLVFMHLTMVRFGCELCCLREGFLSKLFVCVMLKFVL